MTSQERREAADRVSAAADRYDELAEVAELMGDEPTALGLRRDAARCRARAMALLD